LVSDTLTSRTVHGIKWSVVAQILNVATTIAATAVLARLLTPATFGLTAMAGIVLRFGQCFAQMGVGSALVQKRETDPSPVWSAQHMFRWNISSWKVTIVGTDCSRSWFRGARRGAVLHVSATRGTDAHAR